MKPLHRTVVDIAVLLACLVGLYAATNRNESNSGRALKNIEQISSQRISLMEPYLQMVQQKAGGAGSVEILEQAFFDAKKAMGSSGKSPADFIASQDALSEAISRVSADSRVYPRLMADRNFQTLHDKLDETEATLKTALNEYTLSNHLDSTRNKTILDKLAARISFSHATPAAITPGRGEVRIVLPQKPYAHLAAGFPLEYPEVSTVAME